VCMCFNMRLGRGEKIEELSRNGRERNVYTESCAKYIYIIRNPLNAKLSPIISMLFMIFVLERDSFRVVSTPKESGKKWTHMTRFCMNRERERWRESG